jgi:hypothetical protein
MQSVVIDTLYFQIEFDVVKCHIGSNIKCCHRATLLVEK